MEQDYYQILGVTPSDGFTALKRAYYRQAQLCHPDHHGNSAEHAARFRLVVEAFNTLSNPEKRRIYDGSRSVKESGKPGLRKRKRSAFDHADSILDTEADDILEELIVGNDPPENSSLMTLFEDLERTRVFMVWLEARDAWGRGAHKEALHMFKRLVGWAPGNILYRVFLARTHASLGNWSNAVYHYRAAVNIGIRREPPQELRGVRAELERAEKKANPLLHRLRKLFAEEVSVSPRDASEEMRLSANRVLDRMYRDAVDEGEIEETDEPKRLR